MSTSIGDGILSLLANAGTEEYLVSIWYRYDDDADVLKLVNLLNSEHGASNFLLCDDVD